MSDIFKMMKKSGEGMNSRRRRADSDSGIYSFGSASSARGRLSRSLMVNHDDKLDGHHDNKLDGHHDNKLDGHHEYNWRQNIMMDARDSHDIVIRNGHDLYKTVPSDHQRLGRTVK